MRLLVTGPLGALLAGSSLVGSAIVAAPDWRWLVPVYGSGAAALLVARVVVDRHARRAADRQELDYRELEDAASWIDSVAGSPLPIDRDDDAAAGDAPDDPRLPLPRGRPARPGRLGDDRGALLSACGAGIFAALLAQLLALLLFILAATPRLQRGHPLSLLAAPPPPGASVLSMSGGRALALDGVPVSPPDLPARLRAVAHDPRRPLLLDCDPTLGYDEVIALIDVARGCGLARIAVVAAPGYSPSAAASPLGRSPGARTRFDGPGAQSGPPAL